MAEKYSWDFQSAKMPPADVLLEMYKKFVLGCPVKDVSVRGKSFSDLGWSGSSFLTFESRMKKAADSLTGSNWRWIEGGSEPLEAELDNAELRDGYTLKKEFAFYNKASRGKVEGMFYLIRNALAHGSFRFHSTKGGEYFAFETRNNGRLRGRALLRISTLRAWQRILTGRI